MTDPEPIDIGKSLQDLSDEDAIAIMEGRIPAADTAEIDDAARDVARALLADATEDDSGVSGGAKVVELFNRQPWMKMAAAMVFGVFVATLANTPVMDSAEDQWGVASANVVYLEVYRSVDASDLPVVRISEDELWVTLIAYPDFQDAKLLRVYVEKLVTADGPTLRWLPVLEELVGVGNRDSVAVNVKSHLLGAGTHRLRIDSLLGEDEVGSVTIEFRIVD